MTDEIAIKADHVSKVFKLPHDKQNSIKGGLISLVSNGKRTYETQEVLKDVFFEIKKGEFFGIVGRNGSGKSTLLKMLAGIYVPNSGSITVNGSLTPFIELGVGFNPELTGRENVFLNGALLGFNRAEMHEMYEDIVEFAELERFMDQKLKNYSSGMQVRLAFSIAIRAHGEILLLDEVLAVGDAAFQQKCYDYFETLKKDRKTVILVTHDMSAVQRFCSKAMMLEKGKIIAIGSPDKVTGIYDEKNIAAATNNKSSSKDEKKSPNKVEVTIDSSAGNSAKLIFSVKNQSKENTYVGFSIFRAGTTITEMNSMHMSSAQQRYTHTYNLDTSILNPGKYEVTATLFTKATRAPIAQSGTRPTLLIKGYDSRRGGGLKLEDDWS